MRVPRRAGFAAVKHAPHMESVPQVRGNDQFKVSVGDSTWQALAQKTKTLGEALDMGVYWQNLSTEGVHQHALHRLRIDSRKRAEKSLCVFCAELC